MTVAQANRITHGLSEPSKMPGWGYSIDARKCILGAKLRKVKGSVCEKCYALKGRYVFTKVRNALERRTDAIAHPDWIAAMTLLVQSKEKACRYFRWHDSGDLQSVFHLCKIVQIAKNCPKTKFWLPTREYGIVTHFLNCGGIFPPNLCVRLSALMIDGPLPLAMARRYGLTVSGAASKYNAFTCPSSKQDNSCGSCRRCWNRNVETVIYKTH